MDKKELKQLLKENLSVYVSINKDDGALSVDVSISFDGEVICEYKDSEQIEPSSYDYD